MGSVAGTDCSHRPSVVAVVVGIVLLATLFGCGRSGGWRIAFEDVEAGRIAVCDVDGGQVELLTPDSLHAMFPAADTSGYHIFFAGYPSSSTDGPNAVYRIASDGSELQKLLDLPFRPRSLDVSGDGRFLLVGGKYADEPNERIYLSRVGESGFRAVVPGDRPAVDPSFSPIGANFVFDMNPPSDTGWIGLVDGSHPLPIYHFTLRQCTFAPDGTALVGLCDTSGTALCRFVFKSLRDTVIYEAEAEGVRFSHPTYCPDSVRLCFVTEPGTEGGRYRLSVLDAKTLINKNLKRLERSARHPTWVR